MANLTKDVSACSALQRADRAEGFRSGRATHANRDCKGVKASSHFAHSKEMQELKNKPTAHAMMKFQGASE